MVTLEFDFSEQPKRNATHRATSKAAHDSVKEHKQVFYDKILNALERLKVGGTSHEIAIAAGIEYCQCHKRLPELVEQGKVFNTGITRVNPSGRKSMVRQLVKFKQA
jgi:hypothetical protein